MSPWLLKIIVIIIVLYRTVSNWMLYSMNSRPRYDTVLGVHDIESCYNAICLIFLALQLAENCGKRWLSGINEYLAMNSGGNVID